MARIASATVERVQETYEKAMKERMANTQAVEKLFTKHQQIAKLIKNKAQEQEKRWNKKREQYLERLQKTDLILKQSQKEEEEYANQVLNERESKEKQAKECRTWFYEELKGKSKAQSEKMSEVKQRIAKIKETEAEKKERLIERYTVKKAQSDQIKLYYRQINTIREEIGLKKRMKSRLIETEDYSNPYIIAEMRATQELGKTSCKASLKSEFDMATNKTSSIFCSYKVAMSHI